MKTWIILLRGVNVGGTGRLPMKELTALLEKNGFASVQTWIQSGNVVLRSKARPGAALGTLIEGAFGFRPELVVLEKSELDACIKQNPYRPLDGKFAHFYFCNKTPKPDSEKLQRFSADSEEYQLKGKVFYLHAPQGIGRSRLMANIDACLGVPATGRNLNTINKLKEMAEQCEE